MDYKNIEQLLERYWQCETSSEEEAYLQAFFMTSKEIPSHLLQYKDIFVYQQLQHNIGLGEDFDKRILAEIESPVVKAKRLTIINRFMPMFKAAAVIAVILSLGNIAQRTFFDDDKLDYNYATYTDTYDDPEIAYKEVSSALMMLSESINKSQDQHLADSITPKANMIKK
ncbi:hypothetical protein [uncultured Bacteroides sp.]|uniref:hypothetical protein n=1 Tax=uncultured Bacteroides sp. TaxID=162156 RepID=UPI002AAC30CC|nr:hypothetical protein [uncultured Bacteroides sp.]